MLKLPYTPLCQALPASAALGGNGHPARVRVLVVGGWGGGGWPQRALGAHGIAGGECTSVQRAFAFPQTALVGYAFTKGKMDKISKMVDQEVGVLEKEQVRCCDGACLEPGNA